MERYDELITLINKSESIVDFANFGVGISSEWITKAEERLGFTLPEDYKWWLKNYSGGEIYGNEIYSIYEMDFNMAVGGDIVYNYELNKKDDLFPYNYLVICQTDDEVYYFDINEKSNEYPVYVFHNKCKYADNFIDFLIKMIKE